MKYKFLKIYLIAFMLSGIVFPKLLYGRVSKEKTIIWDSTTGHSHDGGTKGKQVPFSNLLGTATDAQIPDSITIDNADKVDNQHFSDIQADTASQITTHEGIASAHHNKTTSFTDLVDTAADAQIPNTITIDQATNADTVDTKHFTDIQSDTASQISTHSGSASAHHDSLSNGYAITPSTVTTTGDIKINSDLITSEILFGTIGDVNLYRSGANSLKTNDNFFAKLLRATDGSVTSYNNVTTDEAFGTFITGESYWRYFVRADGLIEWGTGTSLRDTNLYRDATNQLKTDDKFVVGQDLYVGNTSSNTLNVTGNSSKIIHATTTKYATVSGASFHPLTTAGVKVWASSITPLNAAAAEQGVRGIDLPTGAIIIRLDAYGDTNTTGDYCIIYLEARNTIGGATSIASCTFANGASSCSDTTISSATVVSDKGYNLRAEMYGLGGSPDSILYMVKVTYTTVNMSQTR